MTVELTTGKVFYRDSGGSGIPVVFLHAGSGNSMMWEHQISAFIKSGYRFIAIDYRNAVGDSSGVINELIAGLGILKFHLLGTAAGGGAAFQYAIAHPERLRSLIVTNSIGNVQDAEYNALGSRLRPSPIFNQLPLDFRELGPSYRAANPEGVKRWLALSGEGLSSTFSNTSSPEAAQAAVRGGPASGISVTWEKLAALPVPILLMTGDADLYTPPSVLKMFKTHMEKAEYAIIPESGHSSYWENPVVFNTRVLEFINKH
jgi:pimeloyl-ACP methyl ester carboxylesterase